MSQQRNNTKLITLISTLFFSLTIAAIIPAASNQKDGSKKLTPPVTIQSADAISSANDKSFFSSNQQKSSACVDYTMDGYYDDRVYYGGAPPSGFLTRPQAISPCELEQLHAYCVAQINKYRTGALLFSDGQSDSNVVAGLTPLNERKGTNMCSSEGSMGDLIANVAGGLGCAGAHTNAFVCGQVGSEAQNSCCGRGGGSYGDQTAYVTFDSVISQLDSCLQQMWDEGENLSGDIGHWEVMRSTVYTDVSCGFSWTANGEVMMTQDFFNTPATCSPSCTTCGGSDGCSPNPCVCDSSNVTATTGTASPSASPSASPLASPSASPSNTASASHTRTPVSTGTSSASPSTSPSNTASASHTRTPASTGTGTSSASSSTSPSNTASATHSRTPVSTGTSSASPSASSSASPSNPRSVASATSSPSRTNFASHSKTHSPSATHSSSRASGAKAFSGSSVTAGPAIGVFAAFGAIGAIFHFRNPIRAKYQMYAKGSSETSKVDVDQATTTPPLPGIPLVIIPQTA